MAILCIKKIKQLIIEAYRINDQTNQEAQYEPTGGLWN